MTSYQLAITYRKSLQAVPIKVNDVRCAISMKSRTCVYCGTEIPKGDYYYSYKPIMSRRKCRCLDHPPKIYNDVERFDT